MTEIVEPNKEISFAVKDVGVLYSQKKKKKKKKKKQDWEWTVAQIMNSLLPNSDLN